MRKIDWKESYWDESKYWKIELLHFRKPDKGDRILGI